MAYIPEQERKTKGSAEKQPLWFTRSGLVLARILFGLGVITFVIGILYVIDGKGYDAVLFIAAAFSSFVGGAALGVICEISMTLADQRKKCNSEILVPD